LFAVFLFAVVLITACEEITVSPTSEDAIVCDSPYIRHGTGCCLDKNDNQICDNDEKSIEKDTKTQQLTRADLMLEIGKIINFHQPEIEGTFTKGGDYKDKCGHPMFVNFLSASFFLTVFLSCCFFFFFL